MNEILKRNSNIELLRIISMIAIVIFHYHAREYGIYVVGNERIGTQDSLLSSLLLHSIGSLGVPIFVFISGYYGLKFRKERFYEIILTAAFYTVLSFILLYVIYDIINLKSIMAFLNQWWFLAAYLCLYIISDGINFIIDKLSKWQFLVIIITFYYISFGETILKSANIGGLYIMLSMYLSARWIRIYAYDFINNHSLILLILLLFLRLGLIYGGYYTKHLGILPYINSYVNPLSIVIAATIFSTFQKFPQYSFLYKTIIKLSASALSVYLFSEGLCGQMLFKPLFPLLGNWSLTHFIIGAILTYIIIFLIDQVRIKILGPFISKQYK